MNTTLDYYNEHAQAFSESTLNVDFAAVQNKFLAKLPTGARILDFGCGSGRDAKYFLDCGFEVEATDGSFELCKLASAYAGIPVRHELFQELDQIAVYDGVWACSSILHASKAELPGILARVARALKPRGVMYTSFKYGDFEGERNGRCFSDFTEESFAELLASVPELELEELWTTGDVRPGRGEEKWLNLILRRA